MKCSHCQTDNTKKNGHTHYGKIMVSRTIIAIVAIGNLSKEVRTGLLSPQTKL